MIDGQLIVTTAMMALLTLEAIKLIVRKIAQDPELSLPQKVYDLGVPFLVAAWGLIFSLVPELGFPAPPPEELLSVTGLFQWFLAIVIELMFYFNGISPYKEYRRENGS